MPHQAIKSYRLNNGEIEVELLNIGVSLVTFVDLKTKTNIVLRYQDMNMYLDNPFYMGSIVGRFAGRIQNGAYASYNLDKNFLGKHHLHGGFKGFSHVFFDVEQRDNALIFSYTSPHLEGGFPHEVEVVIKVSLDKTTLVYEMNATPTGQTLISLTQHSYFNLNSNKASIADHQLKLHADAYMALDLESVPVAIKDVSNTVFDLRLFQTISHVLEAEDNQIKIAKGIDHPFVLNASKIPAVTLKNEDYELNIVTDQPCVVIYTGNYLSSDVDANLYENAGVCIECQGMPNHMNILGHALDNTYDQKHPYTQTTRFELVRLK